MPDNLIKFHETGGQMFRLIKNEDGLTLLEVIITMLVIVGTILSIYTGIVYADKQLMRNYHDKVATLLASGEVEWQNFYKKTYSQFDYRNNNKTVIIDELAKGKQIKGILNIVDYDEYEVINSVTYPYQKLLVTVTWSEPKDTKQRKIVIREDFYRRP